MEQVAFKLGIEILISIFKEGNEGGGGGYVKHPR